jgi:hypothetical protein
VAVAVPTAAWAVATAATPHSGAIPTAVSGSGSAGFGTGSGTRGFGGGGAPGGTGGGGFGGFGGAGRTGATGGTDGAGGPGGTGAGDTGPGGTGAGGTGAGGTGGNPPSRTAGRTGAPGETGTSGRTGISGGAGTGFGGGAPGGASSSSALAKALEKTTTRWAAAVEGSNSAASLELASGGKAVMAMGGFTGTDPAPTLAEFETWADAGDITYYIAGGGMGGGPGGQGTASQITTWVEAHFKSATIGGETVYLLLEHKS